MVTKSNCFRRNPKSVIAAAVLTVISVQTAGQIVPARAGAATVPITAVADFSSPGVVVPSSFLGISVEYGGGTVGTLVEPLFGVNSISATANLLNRLGALQGPPVIRVGGASEDNVMWDAPPGSSEGDITPQLALDLANIANLTGSKLIVGLNFKTATPPEDEQWISNALDIIGAKNIMGFELGNEPDAYYSSYQAYDNAWNSFAQAINTALPQTDGMLVGPAAYSGGFIADTPAFIAAQHAMLSAVTVHHYALSPADATIANLLANSAASPYASIIQPSVAAAAPYGISVRYGEVNSVYDGGTNGVTNTFAQSLWSLDTLFEAASTGAAGVNFHQSPLYGAFSSTGQGDQVLPLYYGMLMFAQAAPPGSQIVPVSFQSNANVKIWMTRDGKTDRIVFINKDLSQSVSVQLRLPLTELGTLEILTAPSASSEFGITIGGLTFNDNNGLPTGTPTLTAVAPFDLSSDSGVYTVNLNAASAALLTVSVPDMSPLSLLAVGGLGLLAFRRRRIFQGRDLSMPRCPCLDGTK